MSNFSLSLKILNFFGLESKSSLKSVFNVKAVTLPENELNA